MDQAPLYHSKRSLIALMAIAASCPFVQAGDYGAVGASSAAGTSAAGYYGGGQSDIARRAQARREERTQESMSTLEKGRQYYRDQKYKEALDEYNRALDILPKAPVTDSRRAFIVQSIGEASVALAQQYVKIGQYDEARQLLMDALKINPCNKLAQRELDYLDDPVRTNPAKTPQYVKDVEEVNKQLRMAYGFFDLGQFDAAKSKFQQVLRIDPYNTAARRGMETVDRRRDQYYRAAYDQTRAEMLAEVTKAWETPLPLEVPTDGDNSSSQPVEAYGATANTMKLKSIIIPVVDFEDTTVEEAIEFLRNRSQQLDNNPGANGERGINFVISDSQAGGSPAPTETSLDLSFDEGTEGADAGTPAPAPAPELKTKRIKQLKLRNVPMIEVLKFICQNAGLRYKVEDYAVAILPAGGNDTDFYTRTFTVPPNFISSLDSASGESGDGAAADPFADTSSSGGSSSIRPRPPVTTLLKNAGVSFPDGASASYFAGNSTLLVRNSTANLDMVEQLIENLKGKNKQVRIMTKFVEITQENTDELSFDWVVTPFSANDSRSLFVGGGNGSSSGLTSNDFVSAPSSNVGNWPINSANNLNGLATGGVRSGSAAISRDGIDNLLRTQNRTEATAINPAPGILSMTGIYDEGAFQAIMRGLNQKKGSDVLTAPSVTAKPGDEATIQIIREFIYPTAFEPPQLPQSTGNNYNDSYRGSSSILDGLTGSRQPTVNSFPVTPTTPTEFEMKPVGVTLKVQPQVGENDYVIEMGFEPSIIEFEGFVNYGSPIQSTGVGSDGQPVSITLTDNRIEQPIFSTRSVKTSLFVYDGHTVAIGGLISENVQMVEDKVPIFGDLPFVGRFFRGNSESHIKKNLMIFVTGQIIDATGQPIRGRGASDTPASPGDTAMIGGADSGLLPPVP